MNAFASSGASHEVGLKISVVVDGLCSNVACSYRTTCDQ